MHLDPTHTRVRSSLSIEPNPDAGTPGAELVLDGEHLELVSVWLDGTRLPPDAYRVNETQLVIKTVPDQPFVLEIETTCNPQANTALSGLYLSNGIFCTQCEAEGFRRITYYLDRPDVLATFTTRITAPSSQPVALLSNGNQVDQGVMQDGRPFAVWHDPHPKPSYLFALVAGDLAHVEDHFTTMSGRDVTLRIYVEPGKEDRCAWAMDSLKRSMQWDEEAFGREYDLDIFMIVAISDFNMGAMENKGLNVFNDKYILALPRTATDADYVHIESIIAHEYFHNWTGNRITCRDWFQLCLKEGLTVFRDQEFTSDTRSGVVKRIADIRLLRNQQFTEDAGPTSHPVRPAQYIEINNFYTATIYEKGAELIRMLRTLVGRETFRRAMDLYFERHDGQAATMEQFIQCMSDSSDRDFTQFFKWYEQAGTPQVTVSTSYDEPSQTFEIHASQMTPPTPGQEIKQPLPIPLAFGLIGQDGTDMDLGSTPGSAQPGLLELNASSQVWRFSNIAERPVLSINRGFTAPIRMNIEQDDADRLFLMSVDPDAFNRWEAGQIYAKSQLVALTRAVIDGAPLWDVPDFSAALGRCLVDDDPALSPALKAELLSLPSEADLASEIGSNVEPVAIHQARQHLAACLGRALADPLRQAYVRARVEGTYSPDPDSVGKRSLRAACLALIAAADPAAGASLALQQFDDNANMTEVFAGLAVLARLDRPERTDALAAFYQRAEGDHLLLDKWFALKAVAPFTSTIDDVRALVEHPEMSLRRPNKIRALIGTFASGNPVAFNDASGGGYALLADVLLRLDPVNPQVAARMAGSFRTWRMLEPRRQSLARREIERIRANENLSRDLREIIEMIAR